MPTTLGASGSARWGCSARRWTFTQRLDHPMRFTHRPVHNGQVILLHLPALPDSSQLARRLKVLRNERDAAGLAIQAVHQVRPRARPKVQSRPADQAGVLVRLGGMADQVGRLVDHQQLAVLVNDFEELFHTREASEEGTGFTERMFKQRADLRGVPTRRARSPLVGVIGPAISDGSRLRAGWGSSAISRLSA